MAKIAEPVHSQDGNEHGQLGWAAIDAGRSIITIHYEGWKYIFFMTH